MANQLIGSLEAGTRLFESKNALVNAALIRYSEKPVALILVSLKNFRSSRKRNNIIGISRIFIAALRFSESSVVIQEQGLARFLRPWHPFSRQPSITLTNPAQITSFHCFRSRRSWISLWRRSTRTWSAFRRPSVAMPRLVGLRQGRVLFDHATADVPADKLRELYHLEESERIG